MTTNISDDILRSRRPTRAQDAARLVEGANKPLKRRDCVCVGDRGYLPGVSSDWDDRTYRKRWQVASNSGSGTVTFESVCAPTRQRDTSVYHAVFDLAPIYLANFNPASPEDRSYSEAMDEGILGGVIFDVILRQWISGSRTTVGSVESDTQRLTYALPSESPISRLLYNQFHCMRQGEDSGFAYHEGYTDFRQVEESGLYPQITVEVDLNGSYDPDLPTDIEVTMRPYDSADSGLEGRPAFQDGEPPEGYGYDIDIDGNAIPIDTPFMIHVLGWSVWAVGGS